ncbi:MAG TPA: response regulator [Polyangia bacterium]|nr:response regulator [Polyangia bacterium]
MEPLATGPKDNLSRTILVVDDDPDARAVLVDLLRDEGFTVAEAPNGKVAVDMMLAAATPPALVLLDLNMPLMCGWEVIRIMSGTARLAKVPVALVTSEPPLPGFPRETVVGHLHKPYAPADLLALVGRHVQAEPSDADAGVAA